MSTDVDQILRAHADESARAVPPPDGWARLEQRLADGDGALVIPIDDRPAAGRRRVVWLAAAAALLVVLASVGVLAATRDDEQSVDMSPATEPSTTEAPTTTDAPTTPSTTPPTTAPTTASTTPDTTTTTEPPPPALPTSVVALLDADGDNVGDLVRVDADGGVTTLVAATPGNGGLEEGGPRGVTAFDVLPDGRIVYEMCCEPAGGDVHVLDPTTGASSYLNYGRHPAVTPDGRRAVISVIRRGDELEVFDLGSPPDSSEPLTAGGEPVVVTGDRLAAGFAWSPDGTKLAVESSRQVTEGELDPVVEVIDLASGARQQIPGALDAAFLADGRLLVSTDAEQDGSEYPQLVATALAIADPATGETRAHIGEIRVVGLDATADGRWILAAGEGGAVRAFAAADGRDAGTVLTLDGLIGAAA